MGETGHELFAVLKSKNPEFRQLAEKHRDLDRKIAEYDRLYYLTSEQERKRKALQEQKLNLKDQMFQIMRRSDTSNGRNGSMFAVSSMRVDLAGAASAAD